jgi:hypothetical protein
VQAGRGNDQRARFSSMSDVADSDMRFEVGWSRRIAMVVAKRVAPMNTSAPKTRRECDRIPKRPRSGESPNGSFVASVFFVSVGRIRLVPTLYELSAKQRPR